MLAYVEKRVKVLLAGAGAESLKNSEIVMVLNTTEGAQSIADSREIRAVALNDKIPYFTTAAGSIAAVAAIRSRGEGEVGVRSLQA